MKEEILTQNRKYIVAKLGNGEIVGFAGILINLDVVEIMNIVVRKSYRCQGIGKKLLKKIIEISKETNLESINLEVNCNNIPAIKLYEKSGFQKIGIRKKYYNNIDDAIIMELKI